MSEGLCFIGSLRDAISVFTANAEKAREYNDKRTLIYRGQSSTEFSLQPSVFRNGLIQYEKVLIDELERKAPLEFSGLNSHLETLIKMQHYGLPTRLLDFSFNPLVALFFACQEEKEDGEHKKDNGEIVAFYESLENAYSLKAKRYAQIAFYDGKTADDFRSFLGIEESFTITSAKEGEDSVDRRQLSKFFADSYLFISPPHNNERIRRQNGAFMLFGINIHERNPFIKTPFDYNKDFLTSQQEELILHIIIPYVCKKRIRQELDDMGVNKASLFPELEHQAFYLKEKFSDLDKKNEENNPDEESDDEQ